MQKEIDFRLFDENAPKNSTLPPVVETPVAHFLDTDLKLHELKQANAHLKEQLAKMASALDEQAKSSHLKFEKIHQQVTRLEQHHNGLAQDSAQKWSQISMKLSERRSIDQKMNEIIERHSQVVKTFEVRMAHLQKMLQDKEAQLMSAQSAINEARMEIARLNMLHRS